jgi:hypothetical protein
MPGSYAAQTDGDHEVDDTRTGLDLNRNVLKVSKSEIRPAP